jgi:hypothetical protein
MEEPADNRSDTADSVVFAPPTRMAWERTVHGKGRALRVFWTRQHMNDDLVHEWCDWAQSALPLRLLENGLQRVGMLQVVDFSFNTIGDSGCARLMLCLHDFAAPLQVLKLHSNRLQDAGAEAVAKYIAAPARSAMQELHLSHNQIGFPGCMALLRAAATAEDTHGRPKYPTSLIFESNARVQGARPLWLRLEHNSIVGLRLQEIEEKLVVLRREKGFLRANDTAQDMLCEAHMGCGCNSTKCSKIWPVLGRDEIGGPVAHVPYIGGQEERRPREWQYGFHRERPRPVTFAPRRANSRPCGYTDVRKMQAQLRPGSETPPPRTPPHGWAQSSPKPPPPCRPSTPIPSPEHLSRASLSSRAVVERDPEGSSGLQEGQRAAVLVRVDGPPPGFDPQEWLFPLNEWDEVTIVYFGTHEAGDAGFVWAETKDKEGWLEAESCIV